MAVAVSADGRQIAAGDANGSVHLWDSATGKEVRQVRGHEGPVAFLAFTPDGKTLVSGGGDSTVLLWDLAVLGRDAAPRTARLAPAELESAWNDLGADDAAKAYRASWALARAPEQAVPLLRARVPKATGADQGPRIARLIQELDDDDFAVRERAMRELAKLGKAAEGPLQEARKTTSSPEVRRRADAILERLRSGSAPGEVLRLPRAVEVLERVGSPEARAVLEELAGGAPDAPLTRDARAAVGRLK
jgi:hypothetical protein